MSSKTPVQKKARALQVRTSWSYSECLRCIKTMAPDAIEALVAMRAVEGHPSEGGLRSNGDPAYGGTSLYKLERRKAMEKKVCGNLDVVTQAVERVIEKLDEVSEPSNMSKVEYRELLEELSGAIEARLDCVADELKEVAG